MMCQPRPSSVSCSRAEGEKRTNVLFVCRMPSSPGVRHGVADAELAVCLPTRWHRDLTHVYFPDWGEIVSFVSLELDIAFVSSTSCTGTTPLAEDQDLVSRRLGGQGQLATVAVSRRPAADVHIGDRSDPKPGTLPAVIPWTGRSERI